MRIIIIGQILYWKCWTDCSGLLCDGYTTTTFQYKDIACIKTHNFLQYYYYYYSPVVFSSHRFSRKIQITFYASRVLLRSQHFKRQHRFLYPIGAVIIMRFWFWSSYIVFKFARFLLAPPLSPLHNNVYMVLV